MTMGLCASNREQLAVGAVAFWVLHYDPLGKRFYRAKVRERPLSKIGNSVPSQDSRGN